MDLEEAEAAYLKAVEQIDKWGNHRDSAFARDQVEHWTKIRDKHAWCLPGASHGAAVRGGGDGE